MNKQEAESTVKFFTETQTCIDKKSAFIKGVLYGLGSTNIVNKEPNWLIIEKIIQRGSDPCSWLDIEKSVYNTYKKMYHEQIELWRSMLSNLSNSSNTLNE